MFEGRFDKVLSEAERIYRVHEKNKGDSWKELPIDALAGGIKEEFKEWYGKWQDTLKGLRDNRKEEAREAEEDQFYEVVDLINTCLMYGERLRRNMRKKDGMYSTVPREHIKEYQK